MRFLLRLTTDKTLSCLKKRKNAINTLRLIMGLFLISPMISVSSIAQANPVYLPNQVNYGQVISHKLHEIDPTYGRGALLGAISGAVIAENDRGWGALGGALVGGGLEAAITSGQSTYKVVVRLTNGKSFSIATPENQVKTGDCVAVEYTGEGTDLYKVSQEFCRENNASKSNSLTNDQTRKTQTAPNKDAEKQARCETARSKLQRADDEHYNRVLSDVQRYCQD